MKPKKSKRESKISKKTKEIAYKIGEFFHWNWDEAFVSTCKKLSKKHRLNFYLVLYIARQRKRSQPYISETGAKELERMNNWFDCSGVNINGVSEITIDRFLRDFNSLKSSK